MPSKPKRPSAAPETPKPTAISPVPNRITGRSAFLAMLQDEGITHLFGNPGTTELPIMHALAEFPDLTYVMAMQESLVVAMADGFSRASGRLVAANVHVAPGLGNALGSLYNAKFTGTPLILTAGQQEQGHGLTEPLLHDPLVPMAEPLVKWAIEVTRLADLPRIVRRAAKVATTPPTGPVFISLPGDILNDEAGLDLGATTRIDTRVRPADDMIARLAETLLEAERPVIVVGDEIVKSDALAEAAALAEALGAPVWQQPSNYGAHFLSEQPTYLGTLPRTQPQVRDILARYDLLLALGADPLQMSVYSEVDPMPPGLETVQIGLVDRNTAKNYPVALAIHADVKTTLAALVPQLKKVGGTALARRVKDGAAALTRANWSAKRIALTAEIEKGRGGKPITGDWLTLCVARAARCQPMLEAPLDDLDLREIRRCEIRAQVQDCRRVRLERGHVPEAAGQSQREQTRAAECVQQLPPGPGGLVHLGHERLAEARIRLREDARREAERIPRELPDTALAGRNRIGVLRRRARKQRRARPSDAERELPLAVRGATARERAQRSA